MHACLCMYVCVCVCMHVCMYVCMYVCVCIKRLILTSNTQATKKSRVFKLRIYGKGVSVP